MKTVTANGKRRLVITARELLDAKTGWTKTAGIIPAPPAMLARMVEYADAVIDAYDVRSDREFIEREEIPQVQADIDKTVAEWREYAGRNGVPIQPVPQHILATIENMQDEIGRLRADLEKRSADVADMLGETEALSTGGWDRDFPLDLQDWRYGDIVKKAMEQDPDRTGKILNDYSAIRLEVRAENEEEYVGYWLEHEKLIFVRIAPDTGGASVRITIEHELQHMAQSLLSDIVGGKAGLPPKDSRTPDVKSYLSKPGYAEQKTRLVKTLKEDGIDISDADLHALDDIEFYTDLQGAVNAFKGMMFLDGKNRTDAEWTAVTKMFAGLQPVSYEGASSSFQSFLQYYTRNTIPNRRFMSFKKSKAKYVKAVNELLKAVSRIKAQVKNGK